jgi:hypothetical protein
MRYRSGIYQACTFRSDALGLLRDRTAGVSAAASGPLVTVVEVGEG